MKMSRNIKNTESMLFFSPWQAIGYDFNYDEYHGFVHGKLPYENVKPDPVLRSLLVNLPYRKIVSGDHDLMYHVMLSGYVDWWWPPFLSGNAQIFTNADKIHAVKVLSRLGLEDCFEGIICFETLNPIHKNTVSDDEDDVDFIGSPKNSAPAATGGNSVIFDIIDHFSHPNPIYQLPKTPIVCKPSEHAIERALEIADLSPQRTVRKPSFII